MKFRSDFVTNSSSSSFITFNIKNPTLLSYLQSLGIKFSNSSEGEFSDATEITLPSGEHMEMWEIEDAEFLPSCTEYPLHVWIVGAMLHEIESVYPAKELDEYEEFTLALIKLLNDAGLIQLDMDNTEEWDREKMMEQLMLSLAHMQSTTESAEMELTSGFEGEICFADYLAANNGYELIISALGDEYGENEDNERSLDGMKVAITGKTEYFENREELIEFIESLGGIVVSGVSGNTDLLVCNNLEEESSKMKKAKEFCVPVISEEGLIRRYDDISAFGVEDDEGEIYDELFECTYEGDFYTMFHRYGIGSVTRIKPDKRKQA